MGGHGAKMTKHKAKASGASAHARAWTFSILGVLVTGLAFGGWRASQFIENELASKEAVTVVGIKADVLLDKLMEGLLRQINELERKVKKTVDDRQHLEYLRREWDRLRSIRQGK